MKFGVVELELVCKRETETIGFAPFSYFYGEIGSGKSTIARLIDYCLGGRLTMTPALQSEFVSATLRLTLEHGVLSLTRGRDEANIFAEWGEGEGSQKVMVPSRAAAGVVVPGTKVEVVSDLIFHLSGLEPPRVRRSRLKDDSELERLSFRDLWWYCYLDQDSMDSEFFHLQAGAETFRRLKSLNVLRFVLGIHQERVAELEVELEEVRLKRQEAQQTATALDQSLADAGISSSIELAARLAALDQAEDKLRVQIKEIRNKVESQRTHITETLRLRARELFAELDAIDSAIAQVQEVLARDRQHSNEILALTTKVHRIAAARDVLQGLSFARCPRCAQQLPVRLVGECTLCGQEEYSEGDVTQLVEVVRADSKSRLAELQAAFDIASGQLGALNRRKIELQELKASIDVRLNEASEAYDSAYLAGALSLEKDLASVVEGRRYLELLRALPDRVAALKQEVGELSGREGAIRQELVELRKSAEKDLGNIERLKSLFLDCLVRARLAGISPDDVVEIRPPHFLPQVINPDSGDLAVTSFDTQGSGGKKTLFKCCFALALHRLAREVGSHLPSLLIIDSPMKNISERENRRQFEGFHELLYDLAAGELSGTQFMLIDKEFCAPLPGVQVDLKTRHMRVDDDNEPPLITYYRDKIELDSPEGPFWA